MDKTIGEKLRQLRGSRTIVEVAEKCGISPSALSMYENDQRVPRDSIKVKLAGYYKKSVQSIFYANSTHNS